MVSLVFHMFAMGRASHLFFGGRRGVSKRLKTKSCMWQEKKEKKLVHKEAWENIYASLTYFGDLYKWNVRKEILILLIAFEWKVLNSHNFDLPDINNQLQKCWDTPTKNRPFLLQISSGHRSVRNNTDLPPPSSLPFKVVPPSFEHGLVLLATLISLWRGGYKHKIIDRPFMPK